MIKLEIVIVNRLGLHARAAAQLVKLASEFNSSVELVKEGKLKIADGKSILSVLSLAALCGSRLRLVVEGSDEKKAAEAIARLFSSGFGED